MKVHYQIVNINILIFGSEISKAKVIDMTGPEQRVLNGYTALGAKKTAEPDDAESLGCGILKDKFQLEKLSYNLDTMVDFCEHVRIIVRRKLYVLFSVISYLNLYSGNHSKCEGTVAHSRSVVDDRSRSKKLK